MVPDFLHGENIHSDREMFPLLNFFPHNISKNRHLKYNIIYVICASKPSIPTFNETRSECFGKPIVKKEIKKREKITLNMIFFFFLNVFYNIIIHLTLYTIPTFNDPE